MKSSRGGEIHTPHTRLGGKATRGHQEKAEFNVARKVILRGPGKGGHRGGKNKVPSNEPDGKALIIKSREGRGKKKGGGLFGWQEVLFSLKRKRRKRMRGTESEGERGGAPSQWRSHAKKLPSCTGKGAHGQPVHEGGKKAGIL